MDVVVDEDKIAAGSAARLADSAAKMLDAATVEWIGHLEEVRSGLESAVAGGHALVLAAAAANTLPDTPSNIGDARAAVEYYGNSLFALPGEGIDLMTAIRRAAGYAEFEKTVLGRLWWMAVNWVFADDLISLRDAADLTRTKMPNISQAGLTFIIDPEANQRQERRRVLRSQVMERWAKRIAGLSDGDDPEE